MVSRRAEWNRDKVETALLMHKKGFNLKAISKAVGLSENSCRQKINHERMTRGLSKRYKTDSGRVRCEKTEEIVSYLRKHKPKSTKEAWRYFKGKYGEYRIMAVAKEHRINISYTNDENAKRTYGNFTHSVGCTGGDLV